MLLFWVMANFNEQFLFDKIVGSKTTIANTIDQMEAEPICDVKLKVDGRVLSVMLNGMSSLSYKYDQMPNL